jgi:hypothetical protein
VIGVLEDRVEHDTVRPPDDDETPRLLHLSTVGEQTGSLQGIETRPWRVLWQEVGNGQRPLVDRVLTAMAAAWTAQPQNAELSGPSFDERFALLVDTEWRARKTSASRAPCTISDNAHYSMTSSARASTDCGMAHALAGRPGAGVPLGGRRRRSRTGLPPVSIRIHLTAFPPCRGVTSSHDVERRGFMADDARSDRLGP